MAHRTPRVLSLRRLQQEERAGEGGPSPVPSCHLPPVIPQRLLAGQERVLGSDERRLLGDVVQRVGEEGPQFGTRTPATAASLRPSGTGPGKVVRNGARGCSGWIRGWRRGGTAGARAAPRALPGPQLALHLGPEVEVEIGGEQHSEEQQGQQAVPAPPGHGHGPTGAHGWLRGTGVLGGS